MSEPSRKTSANLLNFDELWFDFENIAHGMSCAFAVELDGVSKQTSNNTAIQPILYNGISQPLTKESDIALKAIVSVLPYHAVWAPRNKIYLVKRTLGLGFDNIWYYRQKGDLTIIQRRLHEPIKEIATIDLLFSPDTEITGGNIRIGQQNQLKSDTIFSWDMIPKQIKSTPTGIKIRLYPYLIPSFHDQSSQEQLSFLTELTVYIKGNATEVISNRLLNRVLLKKSRDLRANTSESNYINLPQHIELISPGVHRLIVDLHRMHNKKLNTLHLSHGHIYLKSRNPKLYCAINAQSIRLVSLGTKQRPTILSEMIHTEHDLGGPFLKRTEGDEEKVEWIEQDAHLDFSRLSQENLTTQTQNDFSPWGINIGTTKSDALETVKLADGIALHNTSGLFTFTWEHPVRLTSNSRLILQTPTEISPAFKGVMRLQFKDGGTSTQPIRPNQSVLLSKEKNIGKILQKISFDLSGQPFLKINKLLIFHPILISKHQILFEPLSQKKPSLLGIDDVKTTGEVLIEKNLHNISGITWDTAEVFWQTLVNKPAHAVEAIQLESHLSSLENDYYWLTITIQGSVHQISQSLRFNDKTDKTIPLTKILRGFDPDETIITIGWKVTFKQATSFYFSPSLITDHNQTIIEELKNYPIFKNMNHKFYADISNEKINKLINGSSIWLHSKAYKMANWHYMPQQPENSSYFQVKQILLNSNAHPTTTHKPYAPTKKSCSLHFLILGSFILFLWVFGRIIKSKPGILSIKSHLISAQYLNQFQVTTNRVINHIRHHKKLYNRSIGVLVIIGWSLLSSLDISSATSLSGFFLLMGMGTLWYEWRWFISSRPAQSGSMYWFGTPEHIAPILLTVGAIIAGWTSWQLGSGIKLYKFLPIIALSYCYLPWVPLIIHKLKTPCRLMSFWFIISTSLYFSGLKRGSGTNEHCLTTLGAISAVFAWYFGLRGTRVFVESHCPLIAKIVYASTGSIYFTAALLNTVLMAFVIMIHLESLATQIANVVYYLLIIAVVCEAFALREKK